MRREEPSLAHRETSRSGSCGKASEARRAQSATSTSAMGTASCMTSARRSRRADSARFANSARSCCPYSARPCSQFRHSDGLEPAACYHNGTVKDNLCMSMSADLIGFSKP